MFVCKCLWETRAERRSHQLHVPYSKRLFRIMLRLIKSTLEYLLLTLSRYSMHFFIFAWYYVVLYYIICKLYKNIQWYIWIVTNILIKINRSTIQSIVLRLRTFQCFNNAQQVTFVRRLVLGANLLWNNMLEPVGNKTEHGLPEIFERLLCPNERVPYIFTNVNSRYFRMTGRQDETIPR